MNKRMMRRIAGVICCIVVAAMAALCLEAAVPASVYAAEAGGALTTTGSCGENDVRWSYADGVLTISGTGAMTPQLTGGAYFGYEIYRDEITEIVIEDGVTKVCQGAFYRLEKLSKITVPASVTYITAYSFCNKYQYIDGIGDLELVYLGTEEQWANVDVGITTMVMYKLKPLQLGYEWTLEDGVLTITGSGDMVNYYSRENASRGVPWHDSISKIKSIVIGDGITSIGAHTFDDTSSNVASVTLGKDVTRIGDYSFRRVGLFADGDGLTVTLGDNLIEIGEGAFQNVADMETLDIPDGVQSIGDKAFYDTEIQEVTLPTSLQSIGNSAFDDDALEKVNYAGTLEQWDQMSVGTGNVRLKGLATSVYGGPFGDGLAWALDADGVLTITGDGAMPDYTHPWSRYKMDVKSIVIDDGVTYVGASAFDGYYNLTSITLGKDVKGVGDSAFTAAYGYRVDTTRAITITLDDALTEIGDKAFNGYYGLTSLDLPDQLRTVGEYAFCSNDLTELVLPASLEALGDHAFDSGSGLEKVTYEGTDVQLGNIDFGDYNLRLEYLAKGTVSNKCGDNLTFTVDRDGVVVISGTGALTSPLWGQLGTLMTKVIIEDGCTSVDSFAWAKVDMQVYVPLSVKYICYAAFFEPKGVFGPAVYYEGTEYQWRYETEWGADPSGYSWYDPATGYEYEVIDKQTVKKKTSGGTTSGDADKKDDTTPGRTEDGSTSGGMDTGKTEDGGSGSGSDIDTGKSDTDIDDTTGRVEDPDTPDTDDKGKNDGTGKDSKVDDTDSNDAEEETPHKDRDEDEDRHGTKYLSWVTVSAGTATTDGYMEYVCSECGRVKYRVPISAYYNFNKESESSVRNAAQGATVKVDTKLFVSFHKSIVDELKARPDVTLVVDYTYLGVDYEMTIPAGSGALMEQLFGQDQFAGFRYLAGAFATVER